MSGLPPAGNGPQYTALQPYYPINQILTIIFGALYVPLFFVALWMHRQKPGYASNLVALFVYSQIAFYVFRVLVARSDPSKEYQVVACDSLGFLGAVLFVIAVANYMSEKPDKEVFNNSGPDYTMIEEQPLRPHQLSKSRINWLDVSYPIRVLVTAGAVAAEVVEVLGILLQTNSSGSLDINNALWMRRGASFFPSSSRCYGDSAGFFVAPNFPVQQTDTVRITCDAHFLASYWLCLRHCGIPIYFQNVIL